MDEYPTDKEVRYILRHFLGKRKYTETRKCTDSIGIYFWAVKADDPSSMGGSVEYTYMRKGRYAEGFTPETHVHLAYLSGQNKVTKSKEVAKFVDGEWLLIE